MVTESPALFALIREARIQNSLRYHVVGLGSFRHQRNSDVPWELGDVFQFDCNQRSCGPFDVRLCWFNFYQLLDLTGHYAQSFGVTKLLVQVVELNLDYVGELSFGSLGACVEVRDISRE
jgi:hypothetical protein